MGLDPVRSLQSKSFKRPAFVILKYISYLFTGRIRLNIKKNRNKYKFFNRL